MSKLNKAGILGALLALSVVLTAHGQGNPLAGVPIAEIRKRAEAGDAAAQFQLGNLYGGYAGQSELGLNDEEMAKWYERAAENGYRDAQIAYASLFLYGRARPADMTQARIWYERAAEQGDALGQYNTAISYENGDGAPKDLAVAYMWAALAAWTGDRDPSTQRLYNTKRDELRQQLSAAELASAETKIKQYQAKLGNPR